MFIDCTFYLLIFDFDWILLFFSFSHGFFYLRFWFNCISSTNSPGKLSWDEFYQITDFHEGPVVILIKFPTWNNSLPDSRALLLTQKYVILDLVICHLWFMIFSTTLIPKQDILLSYNTRYSILHGCFISPQTPICYIIYFFLNNIIYHFTFVFLFREYK